MVFYVPDIYIKEYKPKRMKMINLENLLAENMRRFNTKNLSEHSYAVWGIRI